MSVESGPYNPEMDKSRLSMEQALEDAYQLVKNIEVNEGENPTAEDYQKAYEALEKLEKVFGGTQSEYGMDPGEVYIMKKFYTIIMILFWVHPFYHFLTYEGHPKNSPIQQTVVEKTISPTPSPKIKKIEQSKKKKEKRK